MTTLFSDGFESGNFSSWTQVIADGSYAVNTNNPHHGSYNAQFTTGGVNGYAEAHKTFTNTSVCYLRAYYKFVSGLPTSNGDLLTLGGLVYNDYQYGAFIRVARTNDQLYWGIDHWENGVDNVTYEATPSNPTTGQWYCIEIKRDINSDTMQLWVDGVSKATVSRSISGNNNDASVGSGWKSYTTPAVMYVDCVVLSDSYIGPETGSASKLDYIAGASQTLTEGSVSNVITVQIQDSNGNPVTTGATVGLSSTSQGGSFYSDLGGSNQISSIVISSGQSSGNCYYKDTTAGTPTLTASSAGLTSATTQFTISQSGSQFITSIAQGAPFTVSDGALSLNTFAHTYISDWSSATNAFLTTVTPSNLAGSGSIPSGWIVGGSQVSGNISGNAASITGTILHDKISDWDAATSSFVTSGSTVAFAGLTVSGTASLLGIIPVSGSLTISGAVGTIVNSLDDGSGNTSWGGYSAFKDIGKVLNVHKVGIGWAEEELVIPYSYYQGDTYTPTNYASYLWCTTVSPLDRSTPIGDPVLQTNFAFRVEKDFQTFGFVGTSSDPQKQAGGGAIMMGQGFMGPGCPPMFSLTGQLLYPSIADAQSNFPGAYGPQSSRPAPSGNRAKYFQTDDNALYEDTPLYDSSGNRIGQQWQFRGLAGSIGVYPTSQGSSTDFWLDTNKDLKIGSTTLYPNVQSGAYDTLFLMRADTAGPANLYLNMLQCNKIYNAQNAWVEVDSKLNVNGDFQITGGHVVSSLNPSGSIALGSPSEVWSGINVTTAYVSVLSKLNGTSYIQLTDPLYVNGSVGSSGQVLTSRGSGASPQWTTLASQATIQKGSVNTDASGVANITFPQAFASAPSITCTAVDSSGRHIAAVITAQSATQFSIKTTIVGDHKHKVGDIFGTDAFGLSVNSVGDHTHSFSAAAHTHMIGTISATTGWAIGIDSQGSHNHTVVGTTGVGSSHYHNMQSHTHGMSGTSANTGTTQSHTHTYYVVSGWTTGGPSNNSTTNESSHTHNYSGYSGDSGSHSHNLTNKPPYVRSLMLRDSGGAQQDLGALLSNTSGSQFDLYTLSGGGGGGTTGSAGGHTHNLSNKPAYTRGVSLRNSGGGSFTIGGVLSNESVAGTTEAHTETTNPVSNIAITVNWIAVG